MRAEWEYVGELLAEKKVGFEINTSHDRYVPDETYPNPEIIKILLRKGANIITIGSDAHKVTGMLVETLKMLKICFWNLV